MIDTERLLLETWRSEDWTALRPIATDPEVMRYITGGTPWTDDQIRAFVERQQKLYTEHGYCRWRLVEKTSREMIGFCGVGYWRDQIEPEIGWWLARSYWGRGLATEAARTALRDAFERARLPRLTSIAVVENQASIRIMQKLGLRFESEFTSEGVNLVRYAMDSPVASNISSGNVSFHTSHRLFTKRGGETE